MTRHKKIQQLEVKDMAEFLLGFSVKNMTNGDEKLANIIFESTKGEMLPKYINWLNEEVDNTNG